MYSKDAMRSFAKHILEWDVELVIRSDRSPIVSWLRVSDEFPGVVLSQDIIQGDYVLRKRSQGHSRNAQD